MSQLNVVRRKELPVSPDIKDDRRTYARFSTDLALRIKEPHKEETAQGSCKDISAGGARISTNTRLRPEDMVELWVDVAPNKESLHLVGYVRWLKELEANLWDTGINFHDVDFMTLAPLFRAV